VLSCVFACVGVRVLLFRIEFMGRLIGISCLDGSRALPLDLAGLVWKAIAQEPIGLSDLRSVDHTAATSIESARALLTRFPPGSNTAAAAEAISATLGDLNFVTIDTAGAEVELKTGGAAIPVAPGNLSEYVTLLETYRLHEFDTQIAALCRGIVSVVPVLPLCLFSARQLEVLCTGNPEVDVELLREKTEYRGINNMGPGDRHIRMFWNVLRSFTNDERRRFLQFTWGRTRLPASGVGFGTNLFKVSDHPDVMRGPERADSLLPVSHTCFFLLEVRRLATRIASAACDLVL
jgi:hypothetical protein